jgi:hypothetical protein
MFSGRTAILALIGRDLKPGQGPMLRGNCTAEWEKRKCRHLREMRLQWRRRRARVLAGIYFGRGIYFGIYRKGSSMALEGYKSNNNVVYSSKYHCACTPKDRRSVLVGPMAKRCEPVMRQTAKKYRAEIIAFGNHARPRACARRSGPAVRHPQIRQESQGSFIAPMAARVSHMEITATHPWDESLFRIHGGRGTTGGHKAIC